MTEKELRELDVWVAENIMGWIRYEGYEACVRAWPRIADVSARMRHVRCIWVDSAGELGELMACDECGDLEEYSSDIRSAWKVISAIGSQSEARRLAFLQALQYRLDISPYHMMEAIFLLSPLDICMAAKDMYADQEKLGDLEQGI